MDFAGGHLDLTYYQGLSHLLLRQPLQATEAFHTALDALPSNSAKARAILLLSLAIALAQGNELTTPAGTATEALTIGGDQPIGRVRSGLANSAGSSARPPAATSCGTWTSNCTPSRAPLNGRSRGRSRNLGAIGIWTGQLDFVPAAVVRDAVVQLEELGYEPSGSARTSAASRSRRASSWPPPTTWRRPPGS